MRSLPLAVVGRLLSEADQQFTVTAGHPEAWWNERAGNFVSIRATEPRGIQAAALKSLGLNISWGDLRGVKVWSSSGHKLGRDLNYSTFKPGGLVLEFPAGVDAVTKANELLATYVAKAEGEEATVQQRRKEAPARRREASKSYRVQYKDDRQKLFDEFGRRNVESVTARQVGGDDGYCWAVFIDGHQFVNGLSQHMADYYKHVAYGEQLKRYGKR